MSGTVLREHALILISAIVIAPPCASFCQRNNSASRALPLTSQGDDWKEFSSSEGGFSILFPKNPNESSGTVNVGKMIVKTHTYSVRDNNTYTVTYFDVPHAVNESKVNEDLLAGMRNFVLAELKGELRSDSPISLDNNVGRILEISIPKRGIARAIVILVESRLYRILVVPEKHAAPESDDSAKRISSRYLESFRLLPIDRSAEGEVDAYLRSNPELAQREFTTDSSGTILNGKALSLPVPEYPILPRDVRATGTIIVRVIIDEEGKVIAAQAVGGHPLLQASAVKAARKARFTPTLEQGKPVKILGKVSYNFLRVLYR